MKVFKKIMNAVAVENCILVVSTLLILVLTVGNVFSRKVIHRSWSFTEELVVAVFVLITLMAAALACREGELVNLSLVTDHLLSLPLFCALFLPQSYSGSVWKK